MADNVGNVEKYLNITKELLKNNVFESTLHTIEPLKKIEKKTRGEFTLGVPTFFLYDG